MRVGSIVQIRNYSVISFILSQFVLFFEKNIRHQKIQKLRH